MTSGTSCMLALADAVRNDCWYAFRTRSRHEKKVQQQLEEAGATIGVGDTWVEVDMRGRQLKAVDVRTAPYPGFPTDMQAQFAALNAVASGVGTITESRIGSPKIFTSGSLSTSLRPSVFAAW